MGFRGGRLPAPGPAESAVRQRQVRHPPGPVPARPGLDRRDRRRPQRGVLARRGTRRRHPRPRGRLARRPRGVRRRPLAVERVVRSYALTCRAHTKIRFAFDQDDPKLEDSIAAAQGHSYMTGPRDTLTGWTNKLAARHVGHAPALGSFGDDHMPVTDGWDEQLLGSLPAGGGYCYPNDQRRDDIPEAVVISSAIVKALGWMSPPFVTHWFQDNVWRDLGAGAGCLVYRADVIVRHLHPNVLGKPGDQTNHDAAQRYDSDLAAYQRWRLRGMPRDLGAVRGVRAAALGHL